MLSKKLFSSCRRSFTWELHLCPDLLPAGPQNNTSLSAPKTIHIRARTLLSAQYIHTHTHTLIDIPPPAHTHIERRSYLPLPSHTFSEPTVRCVFISHFSLICMSDWSQIINVKPLKLKFFNRYSFNKDKGAVSVRFLFLLSFFFEVLSSLPPDHVLIYSSCMDLSGTSILTSADCLQLCCCSGKWNTDGDEYWIECWCCIMKANWMRWDQVNLRDPIMAGILPRCETTFELKVTI